MTAPDLGLMWISEHYRVPAKVGARIRFDYPKGQQHVGTVVGSIGGNYLAVDFGDGREPRTLHPTWQVTYLGGVS